MEGRSPLRSISPEFHAASDLLVVIALAVLPPLAGFAGANAASAFCWFAAAFGIVVYLLTRPPIGLLRVIEIPVHAKMDYGSALALILVPPLFFADQVALAVTGPVLGIQVATVNFLTGYPVEADTADA